MISLRNRLLASYLFLLSFTIGGMVTALIVTTGSQPAPPQTTYRRLEPLVQPLVRGGTISLPVESTTQNFPNITPPNSANASINTDFRTTIAQNNNVRVMELTLTGLQLMNTSRQATVTYDSDGRLDQLDERLVRLQMDDFDGGEFNPQVGAGPNYDLVFGRFSENGQEWLFAGVQPNPENFPADETQHTMTLVAERRPTLSLQTVLAEFGASLARPLLQASLIGLVIAVALSAIISRTIAHPLQAASAAATAVAKGDLTQHVPVSGPQEVRAVALAFNSMSAEVRTTQQAQRDFVANVSHDLKTPLTSIQGYAQAITDGAARDPRHAAEIIYDEAARLNRMVMELTDLARLEVGQFSIKKEPIDVGEIATMVARKLAVLAKGKGIKLEARTAPMPPISGDGDRIVQVLTNLLSNAINYTKSGGKVTIQTRSTMDGVEVSVRDNGMGIPQEDLPRIFERFYQVDKARGPSRGTGLGLAIVYEIVQLHGGTINVDSEIDRGTTFTVWLPFATRSLPDKVA